jgi:hypothetical protein
LRGIFDFLKNILPKPSCSTYFHFYNKYFLNSQAVRFRVKDATYFFPGQQLHKLYLPGQVDNVTQLYFFPLTKWLLPEVPNLT